MKLSTAICAVFLLGACSTSAKAKLPPFVPPSANPSFMVANASTIVIGKVTKIESELVETTAYAGISKDVPKQTWRIGNVKVSESLLGAKGLTTIKVGFSPEVGGGFDDPKILGEARRRSAFTLTEEQEGLFILTRHWDGDFYILASGPGYSPAFFDKKHSDYDKFLVETKIATNTVKDPISALKAKDKDERISAATFLTRRYRIKDTSRAYTEEKLSAEEAKLILQVLCEMEWTNAGKDPSSDPYKTLGQSLSVWLADDMLKLKYVTPFLPMGATLDECHKLYKDNATKFINDNIDKFTLKRYVEKK